MRVGTLGFCITAYYLLSSIIESWFLVTAAADAPSDNTGIDTRAVTSIDVGRLATTPSASASDSYPPSIIADLDLTPLLLDGACDWTNIWHLMVQCVSKIAPYRQNFPQRMIEIDLSQQDANFMTFHSKRLGVPRPENISSAPFKAYSDLLQLTVGPLRFVWKPEYDETRVQLDHTMEIKDVSNPPRWAFVRNKARPPSALRASSGDCVYISRRLAKWRVVENEADLLAVLTEFCDRRNRQLKVVMLETMAVEDQVDRIHNASVVILEKGAGMAFVAFAKPGTTVIFLDGSEDDSSYMVPRPADVMVHRFAAYEPSFNFAPRVSVDTQVVRAALQRVHFGPF